MPDLTFVDKSTVRLVDTMGDDDDILHAAWVSNFGDTTKDPERTPPRTREEWVGYGEKDDDGILYDDRPDFNRGYVTSEEWKAWDKKTTGITNFLYKNRHMSPFEHATMKFYIETPIFVTREFMRHRTWSYNEMSGRYTELPGRMFLIDDERPIVQKGKVGAYTFETGTDEQYGLILAETSISYLQSWKSYNNMLEAGIAKEVARNVLPVGLMTQFYATANVRNIMQFLQLRNDKHALKEIRDVAIEIEKQFAKKFPRVYAAYLAHDWRDKDIEIVELQAKISELEKQLKNKTDFPTLYGGGIIDFDLDKQQPYRATFDNEDVLEQPKG